MQNIQNNDNDISLLVLWPVYDKNPKIKLISSGVVIHLVLHRQICPLYVDFFCIQAELREAHKVIADKVATVEEKERLIAMMSNKKKNLTRLNRVCLVKMLK